jgi:hypothetical protein
MTAKVGHEAAIAKVTEFADRAGAIREHLDHILESRAFKGSRRSQEFLQYVVEKSLSGDFEGLKERILGIEIFGCPLTYDTSADAIVRVTANDVRKRLIRYYELEGANSEFRIRLPSGSYLPEFSQASAGFSTLTDPSALGALTAAQTGNSAKYIDRSRRTRLAVCVVLTFALGLGAGLVIWRPRPSEVTRQIMPWSAMFQNGHQTQLIFCDASIEMLQAYLHTSISLSDYANRRLLPGFNSLPVETQRAANMLGGADFTVTAAPVDLRISLRISELAQSWSHHLTARSARELLFRDFKTDADFILLGSPRSNPWTGLFEDQLDFHFVFDPARDTEVCRNSHPKAGELPVYVPTAMGGGTGEAFAIAAFLGNPDQNGNVMILAGSNAEGTEAAAKFVTDLDLLSRTLRKYGIDPTGPPRHFEALLRLTTMAGSPNRFEVIALHSLNDAAKTVS